MQRGDTRMIPYEKIRGLARRPGANVNQLLQPWVTGVWGGRDI